MSGERWKDDGGLSPNSRSYDFCSRVKLHMRFHLVGTVKRLNVEHRTSNIECPILMTLRFIDFKTSEPQNHEGWNPCTLTFIVPYWSIEYLPSTFEIPICPFRRLSSDFWPETWHLTPIFRLPHSDFRIEMPLTSAICLYTMRHALCLCLGHSALKFGLLKLFTDKFLIV